MPTSPKFVTADQLDPETTRWAEEMHRIFLRGRDAAVAENERLGLREEDFIPAASKTSPRVADDPIQQG